MIVGRLALVVWGIPIALTVNVVIAVNVHVIADVFGRVEVRILGAVDERLKVADHAVKRDVRACALCTAQSGQHKGGFVEGENKINGIHGDKSKKKLVKVKKKVKEKKRGSKRPRIRQRREAIPRGFNFVVDAIHEGKKGFHLGNLGGRERGDVSGSGGGEEMNEVHEG